MELTEEIKQKYFDFKDGKIKLPLYAAFDLLNKKENPAGTKFYNNFEKIKKVLHLRNNSILAHGMKALTENEFIAALELINLFTEEIIKSTDVITFPEIK